MADSKIVITAGLDIPDSVNTISKDLYQVRNKLDSDRALKIVCNVDISKTTKRIQSQLDTLSRNLVIKIPEINFGNMDKSLGGTEFAPKIKPEIDKKSTAKQVKELEKLLDLQLTRGFTKEIRKEIASLLTEYKNALNSNDFSSMQSSFDKLDDYVRQFRKEVELSNDELTKTQLTIKNLARGNKVYISGNDFKELSGLVDGGKNALSLLSRAFGVGGWTKDSSKSNISWDSLVQEMNGVFQQGRFDSENDIDSGRFNDHIDGIIQLVEYLNTNLKDNTEYVNHYAGEIEGEWANKLYNSVNKVLGIINDNDLKTFNNDGSFEIITESELEQALQFEKSAESIKRTFVDLTSVKKRYQELYDVSDKDVSANWVKNANGELSGFSVTVKQAGGIVETFNHTLNETGKLDLTNITGSDKGIAAISKVISKGEKDLASFKQSHISILSGLQEPLREVENAIDSLKNGTGSIEDFEKAFNTLKTDAAAIGTSLKSTGSSFNIFDNAINRAENFENELKSLKISIGSVLNDDKRYELTESLSSATIKLGELDKIESRVGKNTEWANKYKEIISLVQEITNNLKTAQKEDSSFSGMSTAINSKIGRLTSLSGNATLRSNRGNSDVELQITTIERLKTKYAELWTELSKADTPESLASVKTSLVKLTPEFESVINANRTLTTSLKNDSALETHKNKVEKLSATMKAFAQANEKAVSSNKLMSNGNTFADEWQKLNDIIAKGSNLNVNELKHLQERFNTFGKEAEAAGLKGASAWDKFLDSFKTLSTYVSASRVLSFITSKIRETVTELQTVNDVLTEISKTSDRTDESLRKLGDNSFDSASKYGRKSSDYLLGVQEMSRAGFEDQQSEKLAELSILAQAAGDMTAEMSNEYLVATDAAYNFKGNVEDLNRVLDGQNYITNKNALSMENLAQATKVSASQAAVSNVAIDELTAAVGTMVAKTQESGDVAGRAFKGILMNIQQVKADADEIGDGGEAITTESLSKYEEATKALGVSLKEVKNGVWELRDPMQILKELSQAVNKESEGSVKVANLINAVGGKFRGNQLIALLKNWDTYEKMLSEFNSNDAVGSAMEEAEKSANNWSGSLNKLSNSWAKLVNQFVNSDNMIESIQSVDMIVQDLTDSSVTGALGTLADILTGIIKLAGNASDKFGTIPTLLTTIAGISAFKGVGELNPDTPIYAPLQ